MDDERLAELLADLSAATPEELDQVSARLDEQWSELDATETKSPEVVAAMGAVVENAEKVKAERDGRAQAQAEADKTAEELRQRMHVLKGEGGEGDGEGGEGDQAEGAYDDDPAKAKTPAPAEGEGDGQTQPTAAAAGAEGSRVTRMAQRNMGTPAKPSPNGGAPQGDTKVYSTGAGGRFPNGHVFESAAELGDEMAHLLRRLPRRGAPRGVVYVAHAESEYPEYARLRAGDVVGNERKIRERFDSRALVASGGICGPPAVDYSVPTWATDDTPLIDALPSSQADRGALMFVPPPDFGTLSGSTAVWTEATDADPGDDTKAIAAIVCPDPVTVYVDAVPTRIQIGNMQGRFDPEWVAAQTTLAMAYAAQVRELNALSKLDANSTGVTIGETLGVSRDLLTDLDLICSAYRQRHRIPRSIMLSFVAPEWLKDMIRSDVAQEIAHDSAGFDPRGVTDALINQWLQNRGVNPIWMIDGRPAGTYGASGKTVTIVSQAFGAQATGAVDAWPTHLAFSLFPEGNFQRLDGGTLDLGVVRDSSLDSTNDYETFVEVFETVAFRGIESLLVYAAVIPNGASSGTIAPTG